VSTLRARTLGFFLLPLFLPIFAGTLVFFQPFIMVAHLFGEGAQRWMVDIMNRCVLLSLRISGTKIVIENEHLLTSAKGPLLVISNHQSMFDIPVLFIIFRRFLPCFVAKKELSHGIPTVSFTLRTLGSLLIDRKDGRLALQHIRVWGEELAQSNHSAVIFPEGTRARDGVMQRFKPGGALALAQALKTGTVVPVAIQGSWETVRYHLFPVPFGVTMRFTILPPLPASELTLERFRTIEGEIRERSR
jgi:1-acyl-sn-glycerol-3-phosphate acyltransferase